MGTLHEFKNPYESAQFVRDLKGRRPRGHPEVRRGKRGGVLLDVGQVWVAGNDELWIVVSFYDAGRSGTYKHNVKIKPFWRKGKRYTKMLSEQTFRSEMQVWDDHLASKAEFLEKLKRDAPLHGYTFEGACAYLGIDPTTGNRID